MKPLKVIAIGSVAAFAIILLVAIGMMLETAPEADTDNTPQNPSEQTPQTPQEPVVSFETVNRTDWQHTERAEEAIQSIAEGQQIKNFIVTDPTQENIAYFAAEVYDEEIQENLISIYKYNTENYEWERLFRQSYGQSDMSQLREEATPTIMPLGYDNGNLVLLAQDRSDSPGPCAEPLLLASQDDSSTRTLLTISLSEPYSGFQTYEAPDEVVEEAEEREMECLDENGLN